MCGIFGFSGNKVTVGDKRMVAYLNKTRGEEGTGLTWLSKDGWKSSKSAAGIVTCLKAQAMSGVLTSAFNANTVLGHLRRASPQLSKVGNGRCDKNAHPFRYKDIVAAHNGYVSNYGEIAKELGLKDVHVDSEVIAALLYERGLEGLGEVSGSASVWWIDMRDPETFNLWCWHQDLAIHQANGFFAFSSTREPLDLIGLKEKGTFKLDPDLGQTLSVNVKTGVATRMKDVKGKERKYTYVPAAPYVGQGNLSWPEKPGSLMPIHSNIPKRSSLIYVPAVLVGDRIHYCKKCDALLAEWETTNSFIQTDQGQFKRVYCRLHPMEALQQYDVDERLYDAYAAYDDMSATDKLHIQRQAEWKEKDSINASRYSNPLKIDAASGMLDMVGPYDEKQGITWKEFEMFMGEVTVTPVVTEDPPPLPIRPQDMVPCPVCKGCGDDPASNGPCFKCWGEGQVKKEPIELEEGVA